MSEGALIVGLGNPGFEYEWTRHNLGFLVVDHLAKAYGLRWSGGVVYQGVVAVGRIERCPVMLLKPMTFMNSSGVAVKSAVSKNNAQSPEILVICDDLNLPFGQLKLKGEGGDGGHNGLTSIVDSLNTKNFSRLRIGIGSPVRKEQTVDYVLGVFTSVEKKKLDQFVESAANCCVSWLVEGIGKAMSQFNQRKGDE